ncbi:MAG: sterol desaturase family protein, partial [Silvibacterium sp.]|nr:sterol desaturase family protein [Silvibacterium sp.]
TFVHYWMHRISHTRRFMWLMFHRPHHMPENMCAGAVLPFVMAFPLSLFIIMPYVFVFGSISRLFYPEPLYYEMTIFVLIFWIAEVHNHNPALYEKTIRTRWIRWLSFAFCNGPYHLLHHAADRDERFRKSAWTANFGLAFFCIWDFLFGTFRPIGETLPELGLTDRPRLVLNPVRLIFSGISQLLYELYWNKSWRDRFLIVFGRADYYPPISKDFALYRDLGKRVNASIDVLHRPQQTGAKA